MRITPLLTAVLASFSGLVSGGIWAANSADCTAVVVDENGVPVADARITLEDGRGNAYRTETDRAGRFTLHLLAEEYKVEVRKEGFFLLTVQALALHAGQNELTFTLNHAEELHEQVQATSPQNQIDPQDTSQRSTLTARDIRDIPVPNTHVLQQSLIALPEILQDNAGHLHVSGARVGETQYLLDGFEIGDPINGALTARLNVDATRAAEVQSGRFGAGYAHAGAGVLSLETPDGDDKWRFGTTNPGPGINIQEVIHLGNWYPRFTLSGPIERGRFWFSESVSLQHTFSVVAVQSKKTNNRTEWSGDNLLRLQYNVTPKHILHAGFLYNQAQDANLGLNAVNPESTSVDLEQRRSFVSLRDQIWLYDTLCDVGVAADSGVLNYVPQGTAPYVLLINGTSGNFFERRHQ